VTRRNWKEFVRRLTAGVARFRNGPSEADAVSAQDPADSWTADSADLWERRYAGGGDAGPGSRGRLARFKADVVNDFARQDAVRTVVELGCGDGGQLALMEHGDYVGIEFSPTALSACRERFADRAGWRFLDPETGGDLSGSFDLALSLDVIQYLVEDPVYEQHMERLFALASRFVMIYSTNHEIDDAGDQVRHRRFSDWIASNRSDWIQISHVANRYPCDPADPDNTSDADFFIFARHAV
jgi:SAM-dependent methyltransferase